MKGVILAGGSGLLCKLMDEKLRRETGESEKLITYVKDRPGHDRRHAH